jgi:hypothetical protein
MQSQITIGYVGGIILNLLIFILLLVILTYIMRLETIGCACAAHSNRDFIKSFTIISLVFLLFSSFISVHDIYDTFGETIAILAAIITIVFYFIFVVYMYLTFEYVRYLINEKCKCSEGISRDIIIIGTMIELLLFVIALFTAIIIPVLIESILSVLSKMQGLKDDVKEGIFNPISSLRKAPKKISKSAKDIGKFLKKSAKDLKKLSKRR